MVNGKTYLGEARRGLTPGAYAQWWSIAKEGLSFDIDMDNDIVFLLSVNVDHPDTLFEPFPSTSFADPVGELPNEMYSSQVASFQITEMGEVSLFNGEV